MYIGRRRGGRQNLYVANVGDSRLYLVRGDSIFQVTRDHSYVEEMVAIGQMNRNSPDYNSHKNIITRAMGTGIHVEPDFLRRSFRRGTIYFCVPTASAICWITKPSAR